MFFSQDIKNVSPKGKAKDLYAESPGLKNHPHYEIQLKTDGALKELTIEAMTESPTLSIEEKDWWKKVLIEYRKLNNKTWWERFLAKYRKPYNR